MSFAQCLSNLRKKATKSRYQLAQYSGLDQSYISRLESGIKTNPSRETVLLLALALVENSSAVELYEVDELLLSAGYAPFRRRGEPALPAA